MVSEVDALYAETCSETGLAAMSPAVRAALGAVQRHRLVPEEQVDRAYGNHPLSIGSGQTISQPYIVALSTDLLGVHRGDKVLDVGTGSGYQAAILAAMGCRVRSIETIASLGEQARKRLEDLGYGDIEIRIGDGSQGWPEEAPFDGIVVAAAAPRLPPALVAQLKPRARMVVPLGGERGMQHLTLITRREDGGYDERRVLPVRFVPLVPGSA